MTDDQIITALAPMMTDERIARIDAVLSARLGSVCLILDNLHDELNISAIIRSCEGLGVSELHIIESSQKIKMRRRVTQNTHLRLDIFYYRQIEACIQPIKERGFVLYGADLTPSAIAVDAVPVDAPLALVVGAEHFGLSPETKAMLDGSFVIPMYGFAQSFNVSVAAGIALHSCTTRRRALLGADGDLGEAQQKRLRARFYQESVRAAELILALPEAP